MISITRISKFLFKNRLPFGMPILFGLALLGMFFFINTKVRDIIHNHVVSMALQEAYFYTSKIDGWFNSATQRVEDMARILRILPDATIYPDILESFMMENGIDNVFIGFGDGSNINGIGWIPPEDNQAENTPWHTRAQAAGENEVIITDPYLSFSTGEIAVSIATYIPELNGMSAVVGTQIPINFISELIAHYSDVDDQCFLLIGEENQVIVHPGDFNPNEAGEFYHLNEIPTGDLYMDLLAGQSDVMKFEVAASGLSYVIKSNLASVDWTLISVIPIANIQTMVSHYTSGIMTIIALGLIALLVVILFFMLRLKIVSAKALEANQAKTTFFSNMNHEIRTPMNAILGMTAIGKKSDDIDVKQYSFERIEEASTHLLGLINDVLDMSKIEAGKLELYNEAFDFEKMIQKVANIMESSVAQKSQQLSISIDSRLPKRIIADEQKLMQVITNLLSNAVKFTPLNGTIRLGAYFVQEENGLYTIKVEVEDTGVGICPKLKPKLFDSYERADNEIARKAGGTGLGLAITKRIVNLFQGEIWVDSELNKGSIFTFTIKVKGMRKIEPKPSLDVKMMREETPQKKSFKDFKLLMVEDIEINREIVAALLEESEIDIDYAENGVEAVAKFTASPSDYDLIFMDLNMPEMDGITATRKIRSLGIVHSETVPIIAMTADVFQTTIDECYKAGMSDYISKPLNSTAIMEKLNSYLK